MATERKLPKSVDQALRTALELLDDCKQKIPAGWPEKVMVEEATLQLLGGIQLNAREQPLLGIEEHRQSAALERIEHHLEDIAYELAHTAGHQRPGLWRR